MGEQETQVEPPEVCAACGRIPAIDPEHPAPHETAFDRIRETDTSVVYECACCETRTAVPKDAGTAGGF